MSATKYTRSIAEDFTSLEYPVPNTTALLEEIRASAVVIAIDYINTSGDDCDCWFKDELSSGDETIFDGVIAAHTGAPLPDAPQEVSLVGDSDAGIARVAVQSAAIPLGAVSFVLGITSDMNPGEAIETVSDPIPEGSTLHLLFARAACRPVEDVNSVKNIMMVELIYREVWENETYDHLFGKSFLDIDCSADFPASSQCWDGTEMVGDGVNTVFVIRRTVYGNVNVQDTIVAVRGYLV